MEAAIIDAGELATNIGAFLPLVDARTADALTSSGLEVISVLLGTRGSGWAVQLRVMEAPPSINEAGSVTIEESSEAR